MHRSKPIAMALAALTLSAFFSLGGQSKANAQAIAIKGGKGGKSGKTNANAGANRHSRGNKTKSPAYMAATETFNSGNYAEALKQFQCLDKNGMCCDLVHYYIALCYQRQNQLGAAQQNFEYVMQYSADPKLVAYAQNAASSLSYYGAHRTYEGNGNNFVGSSSGPRRRYSASSGGGYGGSSGGYGGGGGC